MSFTLNIETGNAAFRDDPSHELARLLRAVAEGLVEYGKTSGTLIDINGAPVGAYKLELDDQELDD